MAQAVVDPAEMRRFAQQLRHFCNDLGTQMGSVKAQLNGLSQTWRDQEHVKFANEFDQTMVVLARFLEAAEQHVPFLMRKADRIEEYLQQR